MLCTFTKIDGGFAVIIQSEDIKGIEESPEGTWLKWRETDGSVTMRLITGTALENMTRLQQEELDLVARVEGHRQAFAARMQAGYPAQPVKRGKA